VAKRLAAGCADYVTSVVVADDVIARFSPAALARLHASLADMSPDEVHEVPGPRAVLAPKICLLSRSMRWRLDTACPAARPPTGEARGRVVRARVPGVGPCACRGAA